MDSTITEKWYERLDRLLAEHAGEVAVSSKKSSKQSKNAKPVLIRDTDMMKRCDDAFAELKSRKRAIDADLLTHPSNRWWSLRNWWP